VLVIRPSRRLVVETGIRDASALSLERARRLGPLLRFGVLVLVGILLGRGWRKLAIGWDGRQSRLLDAICTAKHTTIAISLSTATQR
jgi:hypothetical protein